MSAGVLTARIVVDRDTYTIHLTGDGIDHILTSHQAALLADDLTREPPLCEFGGRHYRCDSLAVEDRLCTHHLNNPED